VGTGRTLADVVAGVGNAISTYTQALDDGRSDDVVATFCPDGSCDMPGLGRHVGHAALRWAYDRWKPRQPQRHLIVNTVVTKWDDHEAHATSDMVFMVMGDRGWRVAIIGRYHDVLHAEDDTEVWRFHSRIAEFVEEANREVDP
jgi:hypothetical protein